MTKVNCAHCGKKVDQSPFSKKCHKCGFVLCSDCYPYHCAHCNTGLTISRARCPTCHKAICDSVCLHPVGYPV